MAEQQELEAYGLIGKMQRFGQPGPEYNIAHASMINEIEEQKNIERKEEINA